MNTGTPRSHRFLALFPCTSQSRVERPPAKRFAAVAARCGASTKELFTDEADAGGWRRYAIELLGDALRQDGRTPGGAPPPWLASLDADAPLPTALEAVLQYNADCSEKIEVKVEFMPFVIGKGGEEINRIRAATGAAIDAARNQHGNEIFIRGSAEAVEAAKEAAARWTAALREEHGQSCTCTYLLSASTAAE